MSRDEIPPTAEERRNLGVLNPLPVTAAVPRSRKYVTITFINIRESAYITVFVFITSHKGIILPPPV